MKKITDNIKSSSMKQYLDSVVDARTDKEAEEIMASRNKHIEPLSQEDRKKSAEDYLSSIDTVLSNMDEVVSQAKEDVFRSRLKEVPEAVSFAYISKKYFGKSRSWLMQKVNKNIVHGKTYSLSKDELEQFKNALLDISKQLSDVAHAL